MNQRCIGVLIIVVGILLLIWSSNDTNTTMQIGGFVFIIIGLITFFLSIAMKKFSKVRKEAKKRGEGWAQ
ncbi:hypothetical protein CL622_01100 [archaeon]|nr:hypothetical protein [archaeon]|tara:strand:- start:787 stop:996 length:210 start_codon:yes stop_codon:yes gene_type:complete